MRVSRRRSLQRTVRGAGLTVVVSLLPFSSGARAQMLDNSVQVRDVPFQAMQVVTRANEAGTTVTRGRMARDAAGSTYVELVDPRSGVATTAFILDVPGRRGIVLDLAHKRYSIRPAPQLAAQELSPAAVPEQLHRAAETQGRSERELRNGAEATVTHLGTKLIAGVMAVGSRELWSAPSAGSLSAAQKQPASAQREMESWFSVDLGLYVRMIETDTARHETTEVGLTEILRVPPDPSLFQVPVGFLPDGTSAGVSAGPAADGE